MSRPPAEGGGPHRGRRRLSSAPPTGLSCDVLAARRGDRRAFDRLYDAEVGRVYALCLRMTGDRVDAEELTQRTFVRAWEGLPAFRGESEFSTWLYRVAVNTVLAWRRARGRLRSRVESTGDLTGFEGAVRPPFDPEWAEIERAVASLPEGARLVLLLHDLEGYRHREIARMTGTAEGTVRSQLHRARELLRCRLAPGEKEEGA